VFLPDIEMRLTRVPYALLETGGGTPTSPTSTELVLYSVPNSISVSEEKDNVRRVIIEARNRLRQRQADETPPKQSEFEGSEMVNMVTENDFSDDPDAMDIE
jgi:hypothetical protein